MKNIAFKNKVCWITGASSGIGAALAVALNKAGAYLILSSRSADKLNEIKQACECPDKIEIMVCDMEKLESLNAAAITAWKIFNHIDYIFLNAGIAVRDLVINTEFEMVKKVMDRFYDSLRVECEEYGVRITIITAGFVRTSITMNALQGDGTAYRRMQESVAHGIAPDKCAKQIIHAVDKTSFPCVICLHY